VIDFEGFTGQPPAMVGGLVEDGFQITVTDPILRPGGEAKGLSFQRFSTLMQALVDRAKDERRRIVAFSEQELLVTREFAGVDLGPYYGNALAIGKRWFRRVFPDEARPDKWSLTFFEEALGIERPRHLGKGNATARLTAVLTQLERKRSFEALTPVAKAKWTKVLQYNELDVMSTAALIRRAAQGLARARSRSQ